MFGAVPASWIQLIRISEASGEIFPMRRYHKPGAKPQNHEILVFGSNTAGRHGKGAAFLAALKYGAIEGQPRGRMGQSYAIPTRYMQPNRWIVSLELEKVTTEVEEFVQYTRDNPSLNFFVMGVGVGNAGFTAEQIAPLFRSAVNCSFPEDWQPFLKKADQKIVDAYPL